MGTPATGKVVTFYSYKGGTGRSMALANVAWILAGSGKKVLAIDWDLEAPGLHRYFEPFLADKDLTASTGVIDFVVEFATAAVSPGGPDPATPDWFVPYSNLLAHAMSIDWAFPGGGLLDFVPAGRQDAAYPARVNSFNWQNFYERLGGGALLEAMKRRLVELYDYILIDSRTGVSDTSGICAVQLPDELVVCFTLNRQSMLGAAAAAVSALSQRALPAGKPGIRIWPVPMRVEAVAEKERLESARAVARSRFTGVLGHLNPDEEDRYWGEIEVHYEPYYAFEEVLAAFRDRPRQTNSLLSRMETIARYLTGDISELPLLADEASRARGLEKFTRRSAWTHLEELKLLGREYESIRQRLKGGNRRTYLLDALVRRVQIVGGTTDAGRVAEHLFSLGTPGDRVVALGLATNEPQRGHVEMALEAISNSRSAFEQYYALLLARRLAGSLDPTATQALRAAVESQTGRTFSKSDSSRWVVAQDLLKTIGPRSATDSWVRTPETITNTLGSQSYVLVEHRPSQSFVRYDDVDEKHGDFILSRGTHTLQLPRAFRIGQRPVTNEQFLQFMDAGGYERDEFWTIPLKSRNRFVTADASSFGPAGWPGSKGCPAGKACHPVSGISYAEAQAFVQWCNSLVPQWDTWVWTLPTEDIWELAARSETGLTYPWGDAFDPLKCNSAESAIGDTTDVTSHEAGVSALGCYDMAGNVWEFIQAADAGKNWCVLRGGSHKNNRFELRSYLRLVRVPLQHRPLDFGFRLAQFERKPNQAAVG